MTITINCNNPYRANRVHNYFYNKGVQVMLCNDATSVSLFNLDRDRAELLLAAFTKYFHLVSATAHALASQIANCLWINQLPKEINSINHACAVIVPKSLPKH